MSDVLTKVPWGLTRGSIERSLTGFNVFPPLLAEFDTNVAVQQNSCTQTVEGELEKNPVDMFKTARAGSRPRGS